MPITISYYGPYPIKEFMTKKGGYDLKKIKKNLECIIPEEASKSSGIYIFIIRLGRGKLEARYVGKNSNRDLLLEALNKTDFICNHFLKEYGTPLILFLRCKKPPGMVDDSFRNNISKLERYLIQLLRQNGHKLHNKMHVQQFNLFDFSLKELNSGAKTFKRLTRKVAPYL